MTKASDNEFPSVLFDEQVGDPSTPASGFWRAYFKSTGMFVIDDAGATTGPLGAGGGSVTGQIAARGSDQTMSLANTFYDGATVSLNAGTYLISASTTILTVATVDTIFTFKLWDGTTVVASGEERSNYPASGTQYQTVNLTGYAVLAGTATWKMSIASTIANQAIIKAAATNNGAGNNASTITAIKIA